MSNEGNIIPSVSGISPFEGPPGTKIIIRGHNLGKDASDLISLLICDIDCTSKSTWINGGKIISIVDGLQIKKPISGPVIITTNSGGIGECAVNFNILYSRLRPLMISSVWIDEELEGLVPGHLDMMENESTQMLCEGDPFGILSPNILTSGTPIVNQSLVKYSSKLVDNNFHSSKFLLERHPNTTWENLKKGFHQMQTTLNLTSSSDLKNTSSYLTKNVPVVINVISDMHKLSKLMHERRFTVSNDLKLKIERLNTIITDDITKLSNGYSLMLSRMKFIEIFKKHQTVLNIPEQAQRCIKSRSNYMELITSCKQLYQMDRGVDVRLISILAAVDNATNLFMHHIIENLITLYPLHFPSIFEFLKTILSFSDKLGHIMLVMQNHQMWLTFKFESIRDSFDKTIKKHNYYVESFNSSNKYVIDFCENISQFIVNFCNFFHREFNVAENIFYTQNATFRKSMHLPAKQEQTIDDMITANEILNKNIDSFILTLRTLLFHSWSILSVDPSNKDIFCSITSVNINQIIRIFNSITNIAISIKNSKILEISLYTKNDETIDKFHFTFHQQFSIKFHNLLFDTLEMIKKYNIFKLNNILIPPFNYDSITYRWTDSVDIALETYSCFYDWLMIIFELFTMVKIGNVFDINLSSKFSSIYPFQCIYGILRDQIDAFKSSSKFDSFHSNLSYYSYFVGLKCNLSEKLTKTFLKGNYENAPFTQQIFLDGLKKELDEVDINHTDKIIMRACELILTPVVKIIRGQYLAGDSKSPPNFYPVFIESLLLCRRICLKLHPEVYKNAVRTLINLFHSYIINSFSDVELHQCVSAKLYKNILTIVSLVECIESSAFVPDYSLLLCNIKPDDDANNLIVTKIKHIVTQHTHTLKMLAANS